MSSHQHLVADEHADAVLAHLARGVAEDFVIVLELDPEHRVGEQFHHAAAHFEQFFLGQTESFAFEWIFAAPVAERARKGKRGWTWTEADDVSDRVSDRQRSHMGHTIAFAERMWGAAGGSAMGKSAGRLWQGRSV